ncbi:MAG: hypothetical protein M0Q88_05800 [Bacilli bacterium]|nr:hypothetical protein [Bacilli bacterium]
MEIYKTRISLYIPSELIEIIKEKAYNVGLIKNGEGVVSMYISMLIMDDLQNKYDLPSILDYNKNDIKRVKLSLPDNIREKMKERARELGFILGNSGNINKYVLSLIINDNK